MTTVTFESGSNLTSIGAGAFQGASNLTSITIPEDVISIGTRAFTGSGLTDVKYYQNGKILVYYPPSRSHTNFIIPGSVTRIGSYAFEGAISLASITIPSSVESIETYAFEGTSKLTSITIPENVTSIGNNAFYYSGLEIVYVSKSNLSTIGLSYGINETIYVNKDVNIVSY